MQTAILIIGIFNFFMNCLLVLMILGLVQIIRDRTERVMARMEGFDDGK
jgi:hypothetical protein